ncbi:hypothetical protein PV10_05579 [Exophiala mesophila]|uniref:tRNA (uracil-O(2)-)-methyltransferase n=1 Tax=Exophiala mesophila TaxID=212818 RepID=A0A0D1ZAJ8_EXOME|nr:uncharacterized protein PV10_05579 [Exophiala mesophila]KIV90984.1 hypothetical protein PV10_05579 [Exophiala mesophila]
MATAESSSLKADEVWWSSAEYSQPCPSLNSHKFMQVTDLLLENPNLNSSHLFRADILFDSTSALKTVDDKARVHQLEGNHHEAFAPENYTPPAPAGPEFQNATLRRRVLRRLIPRKPQVDSLLEQWCYIYDLIQPDDQPAGHIVVYSPQVKSEAEIPWYHPPIKAMAYLLQIQGTATTLSIHFQTFDLASSVDLPTRTHRTFISLIQTFLRLSRTPAGPVAKTNTATLQSMTPSALKDTILPQHTVQDTYSRLKQTYASDLISRWAESTDPSKHVFEDLSIAAFVIELWKQIYPPGKFPGFVDIACGNAVLCYILIQEGYHGRGFDARRRKTWQVLDMEEYLDEMICVPQPFVANLSGSTSNNVTDETSSMESLLGKVPIHNGLFPPDTFIISNHADELTPWTPLLAALSCPSSPLPFLAIPCCSHALSGAKHRYSPKSVNPSTLETPATSVNDGEPQSISGDLKSLRMAKMKERDGTDDKSMYACLTRKVAAVAEEVGFEVELTLLRIPSTRNIGVVGNRKVVAKRTKSQSAPQNGTDVTQQIQRVVERECLLSGGVTEAAKMWVSRAQKLQTGMGRGKVNLGAKPQAAKRNDDNNNI